MNDSVKQINEANFNIGLATAVITSSLFAIAQSRSRSRNSTITIADNKTFPIPEKIKIAITTVESFKGLPANWNGYGANPPSENSIRNSIEFLLRLSKKQRSPSLIIPTPDEGIVVELQEENVRLEFLFLPDNSAEVSGYVNNDMRFDHPLTETTEYCSLKWLVCPDGNCDNWE